MKKTRIHLYIYIFTFRSLPPLLSGQSLSCFLWWYMSFINFTIWLILFRCLSKAFPISLVLCNVLSIREFMLLKTPTLLQWLITYYVLTFYYLRSILNSLYFLKPKYFVIVFDFMKMFDDSAKVPTHDWYQWEWFCCLIQGVVKDASGLILKKNFVTVPKWISSSIWGNRLQIFCTLQKLRGDIARSNVSCESVFMMFWI